MVLESIISPKSAEEHKSAVLLTGGIVASIAVLVSYFLFVGSSFEKFIGSFIAFFITMAIFPFMINLEKYDEAKEENMLKNRKFLNIFSRHKLIIEVYIAFFLGVIIALSILFLMLPQQVTEKVFGIQIEEISRIRGAATTLSGTFTQILRNNTQVLLLSFIFSFIYGAGAIYILAWNSSVLAAAIGLSSRTIGGNYGVPLAVLQYFPHGSLEFLAYFIGAIAGGIISVVITKRKHNYFWYIIEDSIKLLIVAFIILAVAAVIESITIISA
ncbi:MAG TPA: stage II sporulation protein M [archaeon]|nr:stage II sporulation protein M [archaeon]